MSFLLWKHFWATFIDIWRLFIGHTARPPSVSLFLPFSLARPFAKYCYTRPTARWSILETAASQVSPISSHSLIPSPSSPRSFGQRRRRRRRHSLTNSPTTTTTLLGTYLLRKREREREKSLKFRNKFTWFWPIFFLAFFALLSVLNFVFFLCFSVSHSLSFCFFIHS